MDIFRDPVITPSGVTYERATLLEHLRKVRAVLDAGGYRVSIPEQST